MRPDRLQAELLSRSQLQARLATRRPHGIQAVVSTNGLEKAFHGLGRSGQKGGSSCEALDDEVANNKKANDDNSARLALRTTLMKIKTVNNDTVKIPEEVLVSEFADGAFEKLDPFTSMIWPSDLEEFNKTTQGEFSGVGIQIQSDETGNLKVVSPLEDTPAYKAGIKPDDIVTHINGKSAKNISLNQAVRTITGPSGTIVTLTIKSPDGKVKDYTRSAARRSRSPASKAGRTSPAAVGITPSMPRAKSPTCG